MSKRRSKFESVLNSKSKRYVAMGDSLRVLRELPPLCIDAVVTDPPAGIEFMGKEWDSFSAREANRSGKQSDSWDESGGADGTKPFARRATPRYQGKQKASLLPFQDFIAEVFAEVFRVLKPGGHALVWAIPRTSHHTAMGLERAGFEIRDVVTHQFGSGFPKSLDVSKAIDKSGGIDTSSFKEWLSVAVKASGKSRKQIDYECGFTMRFDTKYQDDPIGWGVSIPSADKWQKICEVLGTDPSTWGSLIDRFWRGRGGALVYENVSMAGANIERSEKGQPILGAAKKWTGWGTALKPASEHWILARKPLEGTVAANVLAHGTGALNIDGTRVGSDQISAHGYKGEDLMGAMKGKGVVGKPDYHVNTGRWPANLVLSHSQGCVRVDEKTWACVPGCAVRMLDDQTGTLKAGIAVQRNGGGQRHGSHTYAGSRGFSSRPDTGFNDQGGASRFFYTAKAPTREKWGAVVCGCRKKAADIDVVPAKTKIKDNCPSCGEKRRLEVHPTIKSIALMRYLCRMITPPAGVILDPFAGSGSTGVAAKEQGFRFIGIERHRPYVAIARKRLRPHAKRGNEKATARPQAGNATPKEVTLPLPTE